MFARCRAGSSLREAEMQDCRSGREVHQRTYLPARSVLADTGSPDRFAVLRHLLVTTRLPFVKTSAGRFNKSASAPHADRVASDSFAVGLNLLSKLLHHCRSKTRPRSLQISVTRNGMRARQRSCRKRPRMVGPRALEHAAWKL